MLTESFARAQTRLPNTHAQNMPANGDRYQFDGALATGEVDRMKLSRRSGIALAAVLLSGCAHSQPTACVASPADIAAIDLTVRGFYDALRRDDRAGFQRLTTPTFTSFDGGVRFSGTALSNFVRDAHARGVQLVWNIGPIDTHGGCDMAWAAWNNAGSVGTPPQMKPVRWVESAVLVRREDLWKIDFFHSTRAPNAP